MNSEIGNKTVCVLISCMFQDKSIVKRTGVQTNVVVVNQCDEDKVEEYDFINDSNKKCHVKFISTRERGLSRSRNMAIWNCSDDICLICDDDEVLLDDYEGIIQEGYKHYPSASVVTFMLEREYSNHRNYPSPPGKRHNLISILRTNSLEITFKREDVITNKISFDEMMGSGTGNGSGEEEKFLMDIRRKKLQLFFYAKTIAIVHQGESQWFKGFDKDYFYNKGWSARRILGAPVSIIYLLYFVFSHYNQFKADISLITMITSLTKGWFSKKVKQIKYAYKDKSETE